MAETTATLKLETNNYAIKIENFEGPLDLLCHLIEKNKVSIFDVKISDITDQYIDYINAMERMNTPAADVSLMNLLSADISGNFVSSRRSSAELKNSAAKTPHTSANPMRNSVRDTPNSSSAVTNMAYIKIYSR